MENYDYISFLGQGSYGEVQLVKHVLEGKEYVLKKIGLHRASAKERFAAEQEAVMLSQLKHINIVSYKQSFQLNSTLYIVMQYCEGGDLHTWLASRKGRLMDELEIILWFVQIALALQYLHAKNILHRDLKTQNIFLTHKNEIIKLGDLGIARQLSGEKDMARTIIGTPYYMSPELFSNRPYNFKSDVWSLGCVVYEMCTMKHAFRARDFSGLAYKICTGKVPPLPGKFSTELSCLVSSMLEQEAEDRPNVTEILHLKFIRTYIQMFIKRNRGSNSGKPKIAPKTGCDRSNSAEKLETSQEPRIPRPQRANSVETATPNNEEKVGLKSGHCPHIRQQSNRHNAEKNNKVNKRSDDTETSNRPSASSKRLSNSNHLALIPSVKDLLKKEENKSNETKDSAFVRGDSKRRSSKDGLKYIEPDQPLRSQSDYHVIEPQPIPAPISSARKRRIEDKRKRSRSADRTSPDLFSSTGSDSPSPTLDSRPPSPAAQCPSRPQSPIIHTRAQSPGVPTRSQSPVLPSSRPQSPVCPPRSQSPAVPPSSPAIRPASPSLPTSRPPSPCQSSSRPDSPCRTENKPTSCTRSNSPAPRAPSPAARAPSPGLPRSPVIKKKSAGGRSKCRPLPPTPPSVKASRRKTKSLSEEEKLVDLMNETLLKDTPELDTAPDRDHRPARPLPSYRPLPQKNEDSESHRQRNQDSESGEPPQLSRLRNRLERLRNQVLPCVSRDVLEKAYRVLDESDPEKVQGELVLLVGNTPPGLCNKVMELYICQQRLKEKNSLFQSI